MLKKELGQVFTKKEQVEEMISLIENTGFILEPSAGNGAFYNFLPKEIDILRKVIQIVFCRACHIKPP